MPSPTRGPRLGGGPAHERLMLNNMATSLFTNRRIVTTETKAKRLRPVAERLITFAKRGDLAARRRVMRQISDKTTVHLLFTEIAPLLAEREGGYTRVVKLGYRKGDNAPMAVIELVLEAVTPKPKRTKTVVAEPVATRATAAATATETAEPETATESSSQVDVEEQPAAEAVSEASESQDVTPEAETELPESSAAEAPADAPAEVPAETDAPADAPADASAPEGEPEAKSAE